MTNAQPLVEKTQEVGWPDNPFGWEKEAEFDLTGSENAPFLVSLVALTSRDCFDLHHIRKKKLNKMHLVLCHYMSR